jgi:hypothetical protein
MPGGFFCNELLVKVFEWFFLGRLATQEALILMISFFCSFNPGLVHSNTLEHWRFEETNNLFFAYAVMGDLLKRDS